MNGWRLDGWMHGSIEDESMGGWTEEGWVKGRMTMID